MTKNWKTKEDRSAVIAARIKFISDMCTELQEAKKFQIKSL